MKARTRTNAAAGMLLAPFFVLFTLVMVVPTGYAVWLSLFTEKQSGLGFGGSETVFSGLGNYAAALGDPAFREGFAVLLGYCVFHIPLMTGGALALALLLDSTLARARRFFQLALFLPHPVPGIIAALIWVYLYTPSSARSSTRWRPAASVSTSSHPKAPSPPSSTSRCGNGSATTW